MDKAFILRVTNFTNGTGAWGLTMDGILGADGRTFTTDVFSDTATPGGGWRPLIVAAIAQACNDQLGVLIDTVIFPDFETAAVA